MPRGTEIIISKQKKKKKDNHFRYIKNENVGAVRNIKKTVLLIL